MTNIIKAILNYDRLKERLTLAEEHECKLRLEREKLFNEADMAQIMLAQKKANFSELQKKYDALKAAYDDLQKSQGEFCKRDVVWTYNFKRGAWEPYIKIFFPFLSLRFVGDEAVPEGGKRNEKAYV